MPHDLVNARPVDAAIKEFFGSSQLSQFMDQTNPLAEITTSGASRPRPRRADPRARGFEVRDVHPTHYGRVCPIETPEGPNIGLITSLSTFARVNDYGFIETPYRIVKTESHHGSSLPDRRRGGPARHRPGQHAAGRQGRFTSARVSARRGGEFELSAPEEVQLMDVSPKQIVSVATALIPSSSTTTPTGPDGLEHARQAVPLLVREAPLVGTGIEGIRRARLRVTVRPPSTASSRRSTPTGSSSAATRSGGPLRSPRGLQPHQVPPLQPEPPASTRCRSSREPGVLKGDPLADGSATDNGELALGRNVVVAFMPWQGYNFEDAIIISERLVRDDVFTSVHIEEFELEARDTKLGKEDITRDIPKRLRGGAEKPRRVRDHPDRRRGQARRHPRRQGHPKGETQLTPEEKLLRAIFGEKAGDVRDSSWSRPRH